MSAPHADRDHSEQPRRCAWCGSADCDARIERTPSTATAGSDPTQGTCRCREEGCRGCGDDCHNAEPGTSRPASARESNEEVVDRIVDGARQLALVSGVSMREALETIRVTADLADAARERERAEGAEAERERLADVVARVEALHVPCAEHPTCADNDHFCHECGQGSPCTTRRAALPGPTPAETPQNGPEPALSREQGTSGQSGEGEALRGAEKGAPSIGDTCCGKCPGGTCYVDGVTGA